jgi:hypothetical protein
MTIALRPSLRLLAFVPAIIAISCVVVDFALLEFFGGSFLPVLSLMVYVGVGLLLVLRLPRQPVGWLLLGAGTFLQLSTAAGAYSRAAFVHAPGTLPLGEAALLMAYAWMPALGCVFLAVMLFPTGRPASRRWYLPVALVALVTVWLIVGALFAERELPVPLSFTGGPGAAPFTVRNPIAVDGPLAIVLGYAYSSSPLTFVLFLTSMAAVLARFRTAAGVERQQLKWFAYASSITMLFFVASSVTPFSSYVGGLGTLVAAVALDLIPISVAIAILRYRLYDIDRLINRTVVYAVTTAAIGVTFFGGVVVLPALLRPLISSSEIAVAVSTLVCFGLFQPLRSRVQNAVDRRFDRSRYDTARTLDAFGVRLRDEVALDAVRADLLDAVRETVQPTHASLWLRERAR